MDGRSHIRLARTAWRSGKDALETRWWSMVMDQRAGKAFVIRNGSCGDRCTAADVPRIVAALESLGLHAPTTMIALDDGLPVFPWKI